MEGNASGAPRYGPEPPSEPFGPRPPAGPERDVLALVIAALAALVALGAIVLAVIALTEEEQPAAGPAEITVETDQLEDGAVTADKIADGAITADKIADGSLTGAELRNQAITAAKLADGAVSGAKVAADSLGGAQIDESSLGRVPAAETADVAEVARSLEGFDPEAIALELETAEAVSDSTPDDAKTATAECPAGTSVITGGAAVVTEDGLVLPVAIGASAPTATGWTAAAFETDPVEEPWSLSVTAICARTG